jgi:hypothetical protein
MGDYKLISADSHVNEVAATWERVRRKYGDRAPEIVWNPSEQEHGPYLSIRDWETSLEGKNRESCAMEFVGMVIGGLVLAASLGELRQEQANFARTFASKTGLDRGSRTRA